MTVRDALGSIRKYLDDPRLRKFIRFGFSGILNAAFGYLTFALFLKVFHLDFRVSVLASTILGILFNFMTSSKIVFRRFSWSFLPRFFFVYTVGYFLNIGLMHAMERWAHVSHLVSGAILLLPMAVIMFLLQKAVVFERSSAPPPGSGSSNT